MVGWLVAVRGAEIFKFDTKEDAEDFVDAMEDGGYECAIAEEVLETVDFRDRSE